jgi:nitroreductase
MTIQELMLKRFATKKFDPTKNVSDDDLNYILACARLSCSSANTQPWRITVVTNPDVRAKLRAASYGQAQITEASHLLVISTMKDPMVRIQKTADLIATQSGEDSAQSYKKMVMGWLRPTEEANLQWLSRQVYLALQAMILAAIERGIDSCPMEGFDPIAYAEILGQTDAQPTCLLPIGYATQPGFPKTRVPLEDIVTYVR